MTANWTRFWASHSVLAPRSSMTQVVVAERRQQAASAGRSMPGMVRSASLAIAISAPVLPPDTAASASPSFTALIAMPIEVVLARRIAWLGFSSPAIDVGAYGRSRTRAARFGCRSSSARDQRLVAEQQELQMPDRLRRARDSAGDHHRRAAVAAHRVDCDPRASVHRPAPPSLAAQASVEMISRPL